MSHRVKVLGWVVLVLVLGYVGIWYANDALPPGLRPQLRFVAITPDFQAEFEIDNPTDVAYQYHGYGDGMPLYCMQIENGGAWEDLPIGWCGTGAGVCTLPPRTAHTFRTRAEPGTFRAGLALYPPRALSKLSGGTSSYHPILVQLCNVWEGLKDRVFGRPYERYVIWSDAAASPPAVAGASP